MTDIKGRKHAEFSNWQERTEAVEAMKHPNFCAVPPKSSIPVGTYIERVRLL